MLDIKPMFLCNGVKIVEGYRNAAIYDFNKKKVFLVSKNVAHAILENKSLDLICDSIIQQMLEYELIISYDKGKELNPEKYEYTLFDDCYTDKHCTLLYIEVTDKCNFRCVHCYAEMKTGGCRELSIEQFKSIISNIQPDGNCDIRLTGGEPFLHSNIRRFIDLVKESIRPNSTHSIVTNGSFKSEDALYAMENGFEVQISIYGMNPDVFKEFTDVSDKYWEIVQNNLDVLSKSPNKDKVLLCFAVNALTYSQISKFEKYAKKHGFRYIFNRPASTGRAVHNWKMLEMPPEKHFEFSRNTKATALRCCYHLCQLHLCVVGVEGNVFPCPFLRDESLVMGNVFKCSLKKIWQSSEYQKFRKLNPTNVEKCNKCEFIYMCTAGCCAEAFGMTGNILSVYPWCKVKPYEYDYLCIRDDEMYFVDKLAAGTFDFIKV